MKSIFLILLMLIVGLSVTNGQTSQESENPEIYRPQINGSLKTKVEFDLEQERMRFEVRNARFGAIGKINPYFGYRAEIDLSDEGKIRMLDAFVKITPVNNLDLYLGQRKVPFGTDYLRNPVDNIFANRSFVAKYVNDGLRDIGFVVNYNFTYLVPCEIWFGAMNGTGNNNPQWIDRPNYSGRLVISPFPNYRVAGNFYQGSTLLEKELTMISGEFRYQLKNFMIESEYIHRSFTDTADATNQQTGFYIHSYYNFLAEKKLVQMISPVFRWDRMGKEVFNNEIYADRITAGVNFGFSKKQFTSEIRLNYEKYLKKYYSTHFDRFTIEFIAKF